MQAKEMVLILNSIVVILFSRKKGVSKSPFPNHNQNRPVTMEIIWSQGK
uniref:Uncharacterized protein n=1 Tax=Arundo donax TaxID=35708 RepID=A0A0A9FSM1_ARUDO